MNLELYFRRKLTPRQVKDEEARSWGIYDKNPSFAALFSPDCLIFRIIYVCLLKLKTKQYDMKHMALWAVSLLAVMACTPEKKQEADFARYVNPMIGTDFTGNTYPGAQVPFGMVQLSPDNGLPGWDRISGYFYPDSTIAGFSHTHLSGTGAGDLYDISFMPVTRPYKEAPAPLGIHSMFSHDDEEASAGYYRVRLADYDIDVELTATERCGIQRYTFPEAEASVFLNLRKAMNWDFTMDSYVEVVDSVTIRGYRFSQGWSPDQRVYFETRFSRPFDAYTMDTTAIELKDKGRIGTAYVVRFDFDTQAGEELVVATGLSGVSMEGAGMAFPYVLLSAVPAAARMMPRPGKWMEVLKKILSVPLFATVGWLGWIFYMQTGSLAQIAVSLAVLAIGLFVLGRFASPHHSRKDRRAAALACLALAAVSIFIIFKPVDGAENSVAAVDKSQQWSLQRQDELLKEGRIVYVDFTASWCLTCQYNKTALHSAAVQKAFKENDIASVRKVKALRRIDACIRHEKETGITALYEIPRTARTVMACAERDESE